MSNNAYGSYIKQEVEGASQGKLIIMMYEASIRFTRAAIKAIGEKQIEDAHNNIVRAENIIYELMSTLNTDEGGEVADHLLRLYDFVIWELVDANTYKNADKLEGVIKVLTPLKDAWREAVQKENATQAKPAPEDEKPKEVKPLNISG